MLSIELKGLMDPNKLNPSFKYKYGKNKIIDGLMNPIKESKKDTSQSNLVKHELLNNDWMHEFK